ncbi:bifunctional diguanylate cyclase/phosphodiesterase [Phreatobacter sp.]|uniref:putative bifunctional diguanylate cyclase/phosphodiesterase n=1 Tax=Phreatobacter sp. TaxID=1966341 RepID=UPI0022C8D446|nr:bifunctional diguanylate cyclase/phosphodiesterase [Phreatobacter sp.]MCZ8315115.1 bifunctional diguanylate cyclase/phosphodiesterase [Phreatobacter sp.]
MSISVKRRADAALSGQIWAVAAGVVSLVVAIAVLAIHAWYPVRLVVGADGSWVGQLAACAGIAAVVTLALLVRLRVSQREVIAGARFLLPPGIDGLTGLADRAAFCRSFEQVLDTIDRRGGATLLLLDLDLFKEINDTYGHHAGDAVLAEVARRMRFICGPDVAIGRLGGDEFAVLIEGAPEATDITAACRLIIAEVRKPIPYDGNVLTIGVSIGFCATQERGTTRDDMMRRADRALYLAKARGKNCAVPFHPDMDRDESQRRYQERELRGALINGEIDIDLQPIFGTDGVTMKGAEALARWNHPYRGRVGPSEFVPLAESCGLIHRLGATILRLACRAAVRWEELFVSVNVSPTQFRRSDFIAQVKAALADSGLPPERLVLEITEGVMIEDTEHARAVTHELRALGVKIALDDFGTGFSSLSYLRRFNLDALKVDRSFVADLDSGVEAATILHCVVNLGRALGLKVVAEGVETAEQARFLRAAGCGLMQGYHLARPMPVDEFDRRYAVTRAPQTGLAATG